MTRYLTATIILSLLIAGCNQKIENVGDTASIQTVQRAVPIVPASSGPDLYPDDFTKLIKTANYRFEIDHMQTSVDAIELSVRKHNAFISSSDLRFEDSSLENKLTIRVPADHFDDLLKDIDLQARFVNYRDIKAEDVSKQFVDLHARLSAKREVEQRYIDILRKKAGTIEELLKAEQQIGHLHEEIEATVSGINFLKDQVRYSTIHLQLYQQLKAVHPGRDTSTLNDMREAVISGWKGMITVFTGVLYIWPVVLLTLVTAIGHRLIRRRHRVVNQL